MDRETIDIEPAQEATEVYTKDEDRLVVEKTETKTEVNRFTYEYLKQQLQSAISDRDKAQAEVERHEKLLSEAKKLGLKTNE